MIPALFLILSAVVFRIVTGFFGHSDSIGWLNFAPIAAIALCAAAYFPRKYKFSVPMIALLISDVVLNVHYGFSFFSPFVSRTTLVLQLSVASVCVCKVARRGKRFFPVRSSRRSFSTSSRIPYRGFMIPVMPRILPGLYKRSRLDCLSTVRPQAGCFSVIHSSAI